DEDRDVDTDFCAMCGHDWCSVRISKEIQEFASGKADGFERVGKGGRVGAPVKSAGLTPEQAEVLAKRGYLSPEEVHALARQRVENANGDDDEDGKKRSCHSDYVPDAEEARRVQEQQQVVQLNTAPAHNVPTHDPII